MEPDVFCARATRASEGPRWTRAMEDQSAAIPRDETSKLGWNMLSLDARREEQSAYSALGKLQESEEPSLDVRSGDHPRRRAVMGCG